jgi:hypothetical protein
MSSQHLSQRQKYFMNLVNKSQFMLITIPKYHPLKISLNPIFSVFIFYGVRQRLWTAATTGHIVHPPDDMSFGEQRWNDIDRGKPKNSGKNPSHCHSVHHKSHTDWPGCEPGPPRWETGDWLLEPWHGQILNTLINPGVKMSHYVHHIFISPMTLRFLSQNSLPLGIFLSSAFNCSSFQACDQISDSLKQRN